MPLGLHNKLRVLVPGVIILLEGFLYIQFFFNDAPSSAQSWDFLTRDFSKATLPILLAFLLGGIYRFSGLTHWIDDHTFKGMHSIRKELETRLKAPFKNDPDLGPRLGDLNWRVVKRVFFQFVDELPYLATTKENAFSSGIGYYSCIDLASLSLLFLVLGVITSRIITYVPVSAWMLLIGLFLAVLFGIFGAKSAIRKHRATSCTQLDAILAEKSAELKQRFLNALNTI